MGPYTVETAGPTSVRYTGKLHYWLHQTATVSTFQLRKPHHPSQLYKWVQCNKDVVEGTYCTIDSHLQRFCNQAQALWQEKWKISDGKPGNKAR